MSAYQTIPATELSAMLSKDSIQLIDVRNDNEVATGVISSAQHIPLSILASYSDQLNKDIPLVFYCHSGVRSGQAANFFASLGYSQVFNLQGGVLAWGKEGLPFVKLGE
jgi:rhodanese-related sulfurtransferase